MTKITHKLRENQLTDFGNPNILSFVNDNLNVDMILAKVSDFLFHMDSNSRHILEKIAKHGKLSEYELSKYGLNRFSIRRRIFGTATLPSLLDYGYLHIVNKSEHRTGKEIKKYGLTFKGMIAVLSRMRFEQISLTRDYYDIIRNAKENKMNLVDCSIHYAKYHLALIMIWCKLNNLDLTKKENISGYFLEGITNHLLRIGPVVEANGSDWKYYQKIGIRYFALKHALFNTAKNISKTPLPKLYSDKKLGHIMKVLQRNQNPIYRFCIRYLLKDWVMGMEISSVRQSNEEEIPYFDYGNDEPMDYGISWMTLQGKTNEMYNKIADMLKLRKSSVQILSYFKYAD